MAAPPVIYLGPIAWLRKNLFSSIGNSITTVLIVAGLAYLLPAVFKWAVTDAVLTMKPGGGWLDFAPNSETCRTASGACWDFIAEKFRVIVFGLYPQEEQWRPTVFMIILLVMIAMTVNTRFWGWLLWGSWLVAMPVMFILLQGGVLGLELVETDKWGGLPITLIIATVGIVLSFPIAILLALGRQSDMPIVRTICVVFIEMVRGVPLITVLFMASLMIPLFLPEGMNPNKLIRALVAFTLFAAAYVAEVIRGGLQALPRGQYEAADAMGMSYWQKTGFIILPQALKLVIPPTMNTFIGLFKDTTLIIIISMFDFLGTIRLASNDPIWRPYYVEGLVFAAVIYFFLCYAMAAYSRHLEQKLDTSQR
jgi:general L-amino acid transport system permease protein